MDSFLDLIPEWVFPAIVVLSLIISVLTDSERKKSWKVKILIISLGSVALVLSWTKQDIAQSDLKSQIEQIISDGAKEEDQARSILEAIDGIQSTSDTTLFLVRSIASSPATPIVARSDPEAPKTRLYRVKSKSIFAQNLTSGKKLTRLVFRDSENRILRDIEIDLKFDKPILSASYRFDGAVVIDQGSKGKIVESSSRFIFSTGYLSPSNDIYIDIISQDSLSIEENLSP